MKKIQLFLVILALVFVSACSSGKSPQNPPGASPSQEQENRNTEDQNKDKPAEEEQTTGGITKVNIFLIALEDNGKSGKDIGTGDSVVPVEVAISPPTQAPLNAAINKLLSIRERNYGQSGLYNALYQSNMKVDSISIRDGEAVIKLSGDLIIGGVMDHPRIQAQLEETALQFDTVDKVYIYLNDETLEEALSLK